jgi:hypothetical protein
MRCCECEGYCLEEIGAHTFCSTHRPSPDPKYLGVFDRPSREEQRKKEDWTCSNCLSTYTAEIRSCIMCVQANLG